MGGRGELKGGRKPLAKNLRSDNFSLRYMQHQQDKGRLPFTRITMTLLRNDSSRSTSSRLKCWVSAGQREFK